MGSLLVLSFLPNIHTCIYWSILACMNEILAEIFFLNFCRIFLGGRVEAQKLNNRMNTKCFVAPPIFQTAQYCPSDTQIVCTLLHPLPDTFMYMLHVLSGCTTMNLLAIVFLDKHTKFGPSRPFSSTHE